MNKLFGLLGRHTKKTAPVKPEWRQEAISVLTEQNQLTHDLADTYKITEKPKTDWQGGVRLGLHSLHHASAHDEERVYTASITYADARKERIDNPKLQLYLETAAKVADCNLALMHHAPVGVLYWPVTDMGQLRGELMDELHISPADIQPAKDAPKVLPTLDVEGTVAKREAAQASADKALRETARVAQRAHAEQR